MPPEWVEDISNAICINGIVSEMPPELQAQLSPQGILSILIVPIFMEDKFWGFIGFDDCHNERIFTEEEEAILSSSGLLFATAWLRNETAKEVKAAKTPATKVAKESAPKAKASGSAKQVAVKRRATGK